MIVVPDIHGRTFWKDAVAKADEDEEIIFLGDYHDPYPGEIDGTTGLEITQESSMANFGDILRFAKSDGRVTLLLGNHDASYAFGTEPCRYDYERADVLTRMYRGNIGEFDICAHRVVGGTDMLFSHTCVTKGWLESVRMDGLSAAELAGALNGKSQDVIQAIGRIGWLRGGDHRYGGPLWADLREADFEGHDIPGTFQVFAHTGAKAPIITEWFAMLDCRRAFRITGKKDIVMI